MDQKHSLLQIAQEGRGLAFDMVAQAHSGHLGLPLGCSDCFAVLFGKFLRYLPNNPRWINRDRFILSAGHGSALLYSYLHLSGYSITLEDLKQFRQLNSCTPGHPEFGVTPGVEATTGPLGQGIGNAVGIALSQKKLAAQFNTEQHVIFDNCVVCLCGEGCLQEGVGQESIALAGLWKLDNLILIYDCNQVTLDASAAISQCESVRAKFEAIGWEVFEIDGYDVEAIETTLNFCRNSKGKPHLVIMQTIIGKGLAIEGTAKAHGPAGIKEQAAFKEKLGLPIKQTFYVSEQTYQFFEKHRNQLQKVYRNWSERFENWAKSNPDQADLFTQKKKLSHEFFENLPIPFSKAVATRVCSGAILNACARELPFLLTGSADLFESVKNYIKEGGDFSAENYAGKNLFFGIREHAMGAILNGIAYDGFFRPSGSTFFVFSDYLKPALRVAALSHLPVIYFFSHDSIAVGEDGPTHQPIEQLAGLRSMPNVHIFRPADTDETIACFELALSRKEGPSVFVLSRQDLPELPLSSVEKRQKALKGAYIIKQEEKTLKRILIATGSEVSLALQVAERLGPDTRVVSMPSSEVFLQQDLAYQNSILPVSCTKRIAIEAGSSQSWYRFVGLNGQVVGIDSFGKSALSSDLATVCNLTVDAVCDKITSHKL